MSKGNSILHGLTYPVYAVECVGRSAFVVAGGGGAVKTGVPNRIDVVQVEKHKDPASNILGNQHCPTASVGCGVDTGGDAVMNLTAVNSGDSSFIITLEGRRCIEYLAQIKQPGESKHIEDLVNNTKPDDLTEVIKRRGNSREPAKLDAENLNRSRSDKNTPNTPCRQWELTKLRSFSLPYPNLSTPETAEHPSTAKEGDGLPTCIASGGAGGGLLAIGSDVGSVFLINRHSTFGSSDELKPSVVYPDVSGGFASGVCSLSITSTSSPANAKSLAQPAPLLATVCDQPSRGTLRIWKTNATDFDTIPTGSHIKSRRNKKRKDSEQSAAPCDDERGSPYPVILQPYATASCSVLSPITVSPPSPTLSKSQADSSSGFPPPRPGYHFKHCQFLKATYGAHGKFENSLLSDPSSHSADSSSGPPVHLLATTVQPLCANRKSVSRLVIWLVPNTPPPCSQSNGPSSLGSLQSHTLSILTDTPLPQGHLPACLCVHPSRHRSLIGVGTMDGRVEVYFLSHRNKALSCVYSLDNAHPIFVTALAFLPPYSWPEMSSSTTIAKHRQPVSEEGIESFELVSVSVDRAVRWHHGPSYTRVGRLAHQLYDPDGDSLFGRYVVPILTALSCLFIVSLLPLFLAVLDNVLSRLT